MYKCYKQVDGIWSKEEDFFNNYNHKYNYQAILNEHCELADTVIANPDVEVEYDGMDLQFNDKIHQVNDFFNEYFPTMNYRLKPQKQDEPIQLSATNDLNDLPIGEEELDAPIEELYEEALCRGESYNDFPHYLKEYHDHHHKLSITDEDGKVYEFEKPEFEVKLFFIDEDMHGVVNQGGSFYSCEWSKYTGSLISTTLNNIELEDFNLIPIKPKWYEDEANFPALMKIKNIIIGGEFIICHTEELYNRIYNSDKFRLATQAEKDSLYYEK